MFSVQSSFLIAKSGLEAPKNSLKRVKPGALIIPRRLKVSTKSKQRPKIDSKSVSTATQASCSSLTLKILSHLNQEEIVLLHDVAPNEETKN
mmetsp:Transcript_14385/g.24095  ORF Transcript_14385/g.24095 Transcript_14385/m.24095 type:complete len:92 (-) Transcript_14385:3151-3426(-)